MSELVPACAGVPVAAALTRRHHGGKLSDAEIYAAVLALPLALGLPGERYSPQTLTAAWLRQLGSDHSRAAYFKDLADWLAWCEATGLDPMEARRADVDVYVGQLRTRGGREPAQSTVARRLSAISSWYNYLIDNDVSECNPCKAVKRPKPDQNVARSWLSVEEAKAALAAARREARGEPVRNLAIIHTLLELGLRVGELSGLDVENLQHTGGHRVVQVRGKGRKQRTLPITPALGEDIDEWLKLRAERAGVPVDELTGPLFVTSGQRRVPQPQVYDLVQRVAERAGIPSAKLLSPHSLRRTAITAALARGASLHDTQDFAGHEDPRTTQGYNMERGSLDRSPAYLLGSLYGGGK